MAELNFAGFPPAAFAFFRELAENNEKAWFEANRATFENAVRAPLAALLADAAATFGGAVRLARPHRDVRFSPNKMPYKLNLFGVAHSRPGSIAGLYASVAATGVTVGTGYYDMTGDQLARYRAAVADPAKGEALAAAVAAARETLIVRGRSLKTGPRGFAKDDPHVALARMKDVIAVLEVPPEEAQGPELRDRAFAAWRAAGPLNEWLDRHVGPAEAAAKDRFARERGRG